MGAVLPPYVAGRIYEHLTTSLRVPDGSAMDSGRSTPLRDIEQRIIVARQAYLGQPKAQRSVDDGRALTKAYEELRTDRWARAANLMVAPTPVLGWYQKHLGNPGDVSQLNAHDNRRAVVWAQTVGLCEQEVERLNETLNVQPPLTILDFAQDARKRGFRVATNANGEIVVDGTPLDYETGKKVTETLSFIDSAIGDAQIDRKVNGGREPVDDREPFADFVLDGKGPLWTPEKQDLSQQGPVL